MIEHISFDMDDTLYRKTRQVRTAIMEFVYARVSNEREIPIDAVKRNYQEAYDKLGTNTKALGHFSYRRNEALDLLNSFPIAPHIQPDKALCNMMKELKRRGYGLSILTNNSLKGLDAILAKLGFAGNEFDFLLTADNTSEPKPSPSAYIQLVELARCQPSEVLFVGDRLHADLEPAKYVGMKTMLVWSPMPNEPEHKPWMNIDAVAPCIHSVIDVLSSFGPDAR